jgi:hypothetical protein
VVANWNELRIKIEKTIRTFYLSLSGMRWILRQHMVL